VSTICKELKIDLPTPIWKIFSKLQQLINQKLASSGKPKLNIHGVATLIIENALLENMEDIQDEHEKMGLHSLAVQLAPIIGTDGLSACGFPDLPETAESNRETTGQ